MIIRSEWLKLGRRNRQRNRLRKSVTVSKVNNMADQSKKSLLTDPMFIEPSRLVREPLPAEPIMSEEKSNDDAEPEPGSGDPQIIVRNIKQDPNHFGSEAGKALRDGKELAFIQRVLKKWKEVYQDYGELSDFLAGYFNLTESISWYELQLYGYTIMQINKVGGNWKAITVSSLGATYLLWIGLTNGMMQLCMIIGSCTRNLPKMTFGTSPIEMVTITRN